MGIHSMFLLSMKMSAVRADGILTAQRKQKNKNWKKYIQWDKNEFLHEKLKRN